MAAFAGAHWLCIPLYSAGDALVVAKKILVLVGTCGGTSCLIAELANELPSSTHMRDGANWLVVGAVTTAFSSLIMLFPGKERHYRGVYAVSFDKHHVITAVTVAVVYSEIALLCVIGVESRQHVLLVTSVLLFAYYQELSANILGELAFDFTDFDLVPGRLMLLGAHNVLLVRGLMACNPVSYDVSPDSGISMEAEECFEFW